MTPDPLNSYTVHCEERGNVEANIIKGVVYDTVIRVVNLFLPPNSIKYQASCAAAASKFSI